MTSDAKDTAGGLVIKPRAVAILAIVVGLFPIFDINDWRFDAATFFLVLAWTAIVLTGLFLWRAGFSVASEDPAGGDVGFDLASRRDELLQDKRVLLKAIKEIEFDHQMGKMSDADAEGLSRSYRREAIEVIKALEEEGGTESVDDAIETELRARMKVASVTKKKKRKQGKKKADKAADKAGKAAEKADKAEAEAEAAADAEVKADAEADAEAEAEADADADADADAEAEAEADESADEEKSK